MWFVSLCTITRPLAGFEVPSASAAAKTYIIGKSSTTVRVQYMYNEVVVLLIINTHPGPISKDLSNITKALAGSRKRTADSLLASPMEGSPAKKPHVQAMHRPALLMQQFLSVASDRACVKQPLPPPQDLS